MTSYSQIARENRRRQKLKRRKRPKSDVRKVHRYGYSDVDQSRYEQWSLCGKAVNARDGRGSRAVSDDAFSWLPRGVQCDSCRGAYSCATHEHLMAVELLVAVMQRMWQARLEVGHRCYFHAGQRCSCGAVSYCDATWLDIVGDSAIQALSLIATKERLESLLEASMIAAVMPFSRRTWTP